MCILRSDQNSGSIFNSHLAVISRPLVILNCSDSAHLEQCQLKQTLLMWLLPVRADKMKDGEFRDAWIPLDFGEGAGSWDRVIFPQFPESVYTDLGGSFSSSSGASCLFCVCVCVWGGGVGVCRGCVSVFCFVLFFVCFLFCFVSLFIFRSKSIFPYKNIQLPG